jgi:predicted DNA binding CopG/RHH family protein
MRDNAKDSMPDFASDNEEREVWESHDIRDCDDGPADIAWDISPERKRVTMRLQPTLIAQLKQFAEQIGVRYPTSTL